MNLTYNKISKIFIITLFFSLFLFPTSYINSSPKNLLVEDLLDELQKAETFIEAEGESLAFSMFNFLSDIS